MPRARGMGILGVTELGETSLWQRSRCRPLKLGEFVQAIVVLAFSFAIPAGRIELDALRLTG
jgi:hypothetical protein